MSTSKGKIVTGDQVVRAFSKSFNRIIKDKKLSSTATSVGFIIEEGQKKGEEEGFQVFVKVIRYSEKKLKRNPDSGGLLARL